MSINRRNLLKAIPITGALALLDQQQLMACVTTGDIEGPFYIPGSPATTQLAPNGAPGTWLFITGTVYANDCTTPIPNALVDVWHANDAGGYENADYRGIVYTDASGNYSYQTILPGKYLNGAQFRPRHLHYKCSALGSAVLTTQIYFEGDTDIPADPWASDPDAAERTIQLTTDANGAMHGVADVILNIDPSQVVGLNDVEHSSHVRIQSIVPNPVQTTAAISIALDKQTAIQLKVYDLNGKIVRWVADQTLGAGNHKFELTPSNTLGLKIAAGVYVLRLEENGQPLSSKRFVIL